MENRAYRSRNQQSSISVVAVLITHDTLHRGFYNKEGLVGSGKSTVLPTVNAMCHFPLFITVNILYFLLNSTHYQCKMPFFIKIGPFLPYEVDFFHSKVPFHGKSPFLPIKCLFSTISILFTKKRSFFHKKCPFSL